MDMSRKEPTYKDICKKYSKEERDDMLKKHRKLVEAFERYKKAQDIYTKAMKTDDEKKIDEARQARGKATNEYMVMIDKLWDEYGFEKYKAMLILCEYISKHSKK